MDNNMKRMGDMIKRRTIRYYTDRRDEIIEILAHGEHSPDYVKMLEGARDMATERIQQLTNIAATGDIIVPLDDDRRSERLLRSVITQNKSKREKNETGDHLYKIFSTPKRR